MKKSSGKGYIFMAAVLMVVAFLGCSYVFQIFFDELRSCICALILTFGIFFDSIFGGTKK